MTRSFSKRSLQGARLPHGVRFPARNAKAFRFPGRLAQTSRSGVDPGPGLAGTARYPGGTHGSLRRGFPPVVAGSRRFLVGGGRRAALAEEVGPGPRQGESEAAEVVR